MLTSDLIVAVIAVMVIIGVRISATLRKSLRSAGSRTLWHLSSHGSGRQSVLAPYVSQSSYMWSSQQYMKDGLELGKSEDLLENSIQQIEAVFEVGDQLPSLLTLKHLSERTHVGLDQLRNYVARADKKAYEEFSIRKRSGGRRFIKVAAPQLNHVQKWIHQHILESVPVHRASHAFQKKKSIKDCAVKHCGASWIIKLDIVNFFDNISEIQVFDVFRSLGYQPLVSFELARLCTIASPKNSPRKLQKYWWATRKKHKKITEYDQLLLGYLPQGAPSSPLLSNLTMRKCDHEIGSVAKKYQLQFTRYSDDISLSTRSAGFNRNTAKQVIHEVNLILSKQGYLSHFRKTKIIPPGAKKIILGLNVDGPVPRIQKEYKDRIRQHLYYLDRFGVAEHVLERGFDSVWGFKSHLRGMIDYAHMIEPIYAKDRLAEFKAIDWPI